MARLAYPSPSAPRSRGTPWLTSCPSPSRSSTASRGPASTSTRSFVARSFRGLDSTWQGRRAPLRSSSLSGVPWSRAAPTPTSEAAPPAQGRGASGLRGTWRCSQRCTRPPLARGSRSLPGTSGSCAPSGEGLDRRCQDGEARLRFEWLLAKDDPPTLVTDLLLAFVTRASLATQEPRSRSGRGASRPHPAAGRRSRRCSADISAASSASMRRTTSSSSTKPRSRSRWSIAVASSSRFSSPGWSGLGRETTIRGARSPTMYARCSAKRCAETVQPSRRWRSLWE